MGEGREPGRVTFSRLLAGEMAHSTPNGDEAWQDAADSILEALEAADLFVTYGNKLTVLARLRRQLAGEKEFQRKLARLTAEATSERDRARNLNRDLKLQAQALTGRALRAEAELDAALCALQDIEGWCRDAPPSELRSQLDRVMGAHAENPVEYGVLAGRRMPAEGGE